MATRPYLWLLIASGWCVCDYAWICIVNAKNYTSLVHVTGNAAAGATLLLDFRLLKQLFLKSPPYSHALLCYSWFQLTLSSWTGSTANFEITCLAFQMWETIACKATRGEDINDSTQGCTISFSCTWWDKDSLAALPQIFHWQDSISDCWQRIQCLLRVSHLTVPTPFFDTLPCP